MMGEPDLGNIAFNHFLRDGKLMGAKCRSCGAIFVPPRPMCNKCFGSELEWIELKGKGRLESFTCTAVGTPLMAAAGYSAENPYCVGIVKLEEGVNVVALIDGVEASRPESIQISMPLEISFDTSEKNGGSGSYLVFRL